MPTSPNRLSIAVIITATLFSVPASARPDARTMTCSQSQALVDQLGAIVLTTGRNTYDRYVRSSAQCAFMERAELDYVQTRDDPTCPLRRCHRAEPLFEFGR